MDGRQDDSTLWLVRSFDLQPDRDLAVSLAFDLWSESESFNTLAMVAVYAGPRPPQAEEDFDLSQAANLASGWRRYTYNIPARSDMIRTGLGGGGDQRRLGDRGDRLEQEGTYTTLLGWVNHYRLAGDQLELSTLRGETLTFDPWPQDDWLPLEGPTWSLIAFAEPNPQAEPSDSIPLPAGLLAGTEITATFAGGAVRGSTGCNHYSAAYQPQGDSLIVGSIAVTEMACLDPEGIMDQEGRFLDLLARVTGYHIYGDRLWLRTGDGHVVVFRAPDG